MKKKYAILYFVPVLLLILLFLTGCPPPTTPPSDSDSLCFIATAAYGTPAAEEIDVLRNFRDQYLSDSPAGAWFIRNYYKYSPPVADFITKHEILRTLVREGFVEPIVKIIEWTECWWKK